jgi:hypothetical protein
MKIIYEDKPIAKAVREVLTGNAHVLRVPTFFSKAACERMARIVDGSDMTGAYLNAPEIKRTGRAYFERGRGANAEAVLDYDTNAVSWMAQMRDAAAPMQLPIDRLRLTLDDLWPAGATVATIEGTRAFCGLMRIFEPGASAEPHMDVLAWDVTEGHPDGELAGQAAANVYLTMPESGGELTIWPMTLDYEAYQRHRRPGSYGLTIEALSCQPVTLKPEVGELIIFNSNLVHAVEPGRGGDRVTASCFIGYRADNSPLIFWS